METENVGKIPRAVALPLKRPRNLVYQNRYIPKIDATGRPGQLYRTRKSARARVTSPVRASVIVTLME
jgi:hypothetical protein